MWRGAGYQGVILSGSGGGMAVRCGNKWHGSEWHNYFCSGAISVLDAGGVIPQLSMVSHVRCVHSIPRPWMAILLHLSK